MASLFYFLYLHYKIFLELSPKNLLRLQQPEVKPGKKTKEELRQLWKMAIDQTVLLVRMEKENARLKGTYTKIYFKRLKNIIVYVTMSIERLILKYTYFSMAICVKNSYYY